MSENKKWYECNQCEKKLSSYKSLWRHKKICKLNADNTSAFSETSAISSKEQGNLMNNTRDAEFGVNIDQIINGSITSEKNPSQDKHDGNKESVSSFHHQEGKTGELWKIDDDHKILNNSNKQKLVLPITRKNGKDDVEDYIDLPLSPFVMGSNNFNKKCSENCTTNEENMDMKAHNENEDNSGESKKHGGEEGQGMNVYGIEIPDKALTNLELLDYCKQLHIKTLRGVFARDSLPAYPNRNECGIVNLNTFSEPGSHWVCYFKTGKDRIYFDSYGQITPYEVQKYLKMKNEINQQVIKRNTDIVQPAGTQICGHLCLYVLKSLSDGMKFHDILEGLITLKEGKGIKWTDELANELHKPLRHHFQKRYVFAQDVDDIWAADLVDMRGLSEENDNYNYILMVIDVFSKYGWAQPMLNKSGISLRKALEDIFKEGKLPKMIWADRGTEFYNKNVKELLKEHKISLYSTGNPEKSSVVERWNRTMKTWLWKYFTANGTHKYLDVLQELVKKYNSTKHRSIKLTPLEARKQSKYLQVFKNLYHDKTEKLLKTYKGKVPKFKVGDKVRLAVLKDTFEKAYIINYTDKIYTIKEVKWTLPYTYVVEDDRGKVHTGTFYEQDLQKVNVDRFRIEKIIDWKTINGKRFGLVKWMDYDDSYNSWEPAENL